MLRTRGLFCAWRAGLSPEAIEIIDTHVRTHPKEESEIHKRLRMKWLGQSLRATLNANTATEDRVARLSQLAKANNVTTLEVAMQLGAQEDKRIAEQFHNQRDDVAKLFQRWNSYEEERGGTVTRF